MNSVVHNSINELLSLDVIDYLRDCIEEASGVELLFIGKIDADGVVISATAVAKGGFSSVAAIMREMVKGDVVIHNHPTENLTASSADVDVSSNLAQSGIGSYIVNNDVTNISVLVRPINIHVIKNIKSNDLLDFFSSQTGLTKFIKDYEYRESQVEMMRSVIDCFNNKTLSILEAGTGIGKSLAYLIPAIKWILENDERVVISTATINLQHQLVEKDIPLALQVLGASINYILVKGRNNYICLRKLDEEYSAGSLFDDETEQLRFLNDWSKSSESGAYDDIKGISISDLLKMRTCSESETCFGGKCKHYNECFVMKVRKKANISKLIVVNNHLLFSDSSVKAESENAAGILPNYNRVIFDEAHNIDNDATKHFTEVLDSKTVSSIDSKIKFKNNRRVTGVLNKLKKYNFITPDIISDISEASTAMVNTTTLLETVALETLKIDSSLLIELSLPKAVSEIFLELSKNFENLYKKLSVALKTLENNKSNLPKDYTEDKELIGIMSRLSCLMSVSAMYSNISENDDTIFWVENYKYNNIQKISFNATPISISKLLDENIWQKKESVVFTSATLSINKKFDFFKKSLGLDFSSRVFENSYQSPFDYKNRVVFSIPTDALDLSDENNYLEYAIDFTKEYLEKSHGRALLLFTSFKHLRAVYDAVYPFLTEISIKCYKQESRSNKMQLLEDFKKDISSVLFATSSFWEGVDVPGEALEHLIMYKLPFPRPNEPIFKARSKIIELYGKNAFFELSLPITVMHFKQGFGRIMRKTSDKGSVVLLDNRVLAKNCRYSDKVLNSIPETKKCFKNKEVIFNQVISYIQNLK